MPKHIPLLLAAATFAGAIGAPAQAQTPRTEDEKTTYVIGYLLGEALTPFSLSDEELDMVIAGLKARVADEAPLVSPQAYQGKVAELRDQRMMAVIEEEKAASAEFLAEAASEEGARTTDSGLIFRQLEAGEGASPGASDTVQVHYEGTLRDGTVFDSSYERGQPASFPLNGVIACWTEALQMMQVGGKAKLTCPADLAYGDRGIPPRIPGGAVLTFQVELLEILEDEEGGPAMPQDEASGADEGAGQRR